MVPRLALMAALATALLACVGGDDAGETDPAGGESQASVAVSLGTPHEFGLEVLPAAIAAGRVQFDVTNRGELLHAFAVVTLDGEPTALPLAGSSVDLSQLEVLAAIPEVGPADASSVTVELEPGEYLVFCTIGGHYISGMWSLLTVE